MFQNFFFLCKKNRAKRFLHGLVISTFRYLVNFSFCKAVCFKISFLVEQRLFVRLLQNSMFEAAKVNRKARIVFAFGTSTPFLIKEKAKFACLIFLDVVTSLHTFFCAKNSRAKRFLHGLVISTFSYLVNFSFCKAVCFKISFLVEQRLFVRLLQNSMFEAAKVNRLATVRKAGASGCHVFLQRRFDFLSYLLSCTAKTSSSNKKV